MNKNKNVSRETKPKKYGLLDLLYDYQKNKYINTEWEKTKNIVTYGLIYNLFRGNKK